MHKDGSAVKILFAARRTSDPATKCQQTPAPGFGSISASSGSVASGASVTVSAIVASATTGTPTGTVSFYDGTAFLGTTPLSNGAAMYSTTSLAPGVTHTLTAAYGGDMNFMASASAAGATVVTTPLDFTFTGHTPAALVQTRPPSRSACRG